MEPGADNAAWGRYLSKVVVVDTTSTYVYIGTLSSVVDHWLILKDVDVHDRGETPTTKEKYVLDAKRFGVKPNRREVSIRKDVVTSLSLLEEIVEY